METVFPGAESHAEQQAKGLQIFETVTPKIAEQAKTLVASGSMQVTAGFNQKGIYAQCAVDSNGETAQVILGM